MENEEILQKAIEKAVKHGFLDWGVRRGLAVYSVIFSHDFAKAFWGDDELYMTIQGDLPVNWCPAWKHHLQQMVLEENPILYLEKFLTI